MPYKIKKYTEPTHKKKCWSVVNTETGKVHSICTTKLKAERQLRLLEGLQEGEGIKETIQDIIGYVRKNVPFQQRKAGLLPPKSRKLLEQVKDETITRLVVVRTPIESYINNTLNVVSFGSWENAVKSTGYDKLFHLSLFINDKYVFHKIEVTTLAVENPIKANSETMDASAGLSKISSTGVPLSIGVLVENTKKRMGDEKFTQYDPVNNNCQDFLLAVLDSNGLSTPELVKFIKQDAVKIFEKTPKLTSLVARVATNLGSRLNRFIEGEGGEQKLPKLPKLASMKTMTTGNRNEWINALKIYNEGKKWTIPKKGSVEYEKVLSIMLEKKNPKK